ncbi:MAG: ABC transporter permease [Actinomycetota bacterium]|jgi:osmoprotectant transport system permease protein|nr:ABC transporter permease [Actinomycetota bacterium]
MAEVATSDQLADEVLAELGGPSPLWRWLGTPALLGGVLLALYLYVQGQELDRIEQATINADFIGEKLIEHLQLTAVSTALVIAIAVPLGVLLTRGGARRWSAPFLGVANIGQAVPSIGVIVLLAVTVGIGFDKAIIALVLYSTLPVLRNTMVGLQQVDRSLIEAGRGMGMSTLAVLVRIELPLAVPVMLAGIRTALIINVGTATLATFINAGGLGFIIDNGIRLNRDLVLVTGSVLTAVLALLVDWLAGMVEDVLRPKGL